MKSGAICGLLTILALVMLTFILAAVPGFPFNMKDLELNIYMEIASVLVPFCVVRSKPYLIVSWKVRVPLEIYITAAYALVPIILIHAPRSCSAG